MGYYESPTIIERSGNGERAYDLYSRLLKDRIIFVDGEIRDDNADMIVAQLLYLESDNPEKDISMYINSPGGSVTAGLAVYDTMQYVKQAWVQCFLQAEQSENVMPCPQAAY